MIYLHGTFPLGIVIEHFSCIHFSWNIFEYSLVLFLKYIKLIGNHSTSQVYLHDKLLPKLYAVLVVFLTICSKYLLLWYKLPSNIAVQATNIYYLVVSKSQESRWFGWVESGWFWLQICCEVAVISRQHDWRICFQAQSHGGLQASVLHRLLGRRSVPRAVSVS